MVFNLENDCVTLSVMVCHPLPPTSERGRVVPPNCGALDFEIPGAPFYVSIPKPACDPNMTQVLGPGLAAAKLNQQTSFVVNLFDAKGGSCEPGAHVDVLFGDELGNKIEGMPPFCLPQIVQSPVQSRFRKLNSRLTEIHSLQISVKTHFFHFRY